MTSYVLRRLLQAIPLLFLISVLCFALMQLAPGGPLARLQGNPHVRAEDIAALKHALGLDVPLPVQYWRWTTRAVLHGDLGISLVTRQPVSGMILERLPATGELMLTSFLISLAAGLGVGIVAALRRASALDYAATFLAFVGISLPVFWIGLMAQLLFSVRLGWLPATGRVTLDAAQPGLPDVLRHLVLPAGVLSLLYMSSWSRYMRGTLIEVLSLDYVRTARAKGLGPAAVVVRHAVRNALVPVVTIVALQVPTLFTGAIITEAVFAWPGMGRLFYDGVGKGDYPRLMAILMITSALFVLFNLLADVLYAFLDPRVTFR